jgi:hypothetical protein
MTARIACRRLPTRTPAVSTVLLSLLLGLTAGCGATDAGSGWRGSEETLPNGALRITNPAEGVWGEGGGWRLEQELQVGVVEGADAYMFATIIGLEADDDGRIYVLDRQANELRIFAPDGVHLRTTGRDGGGPGEYSNANGLLWLAQDTLLVIDQRGNRYSVLTRDGDYVRSVQRRLPFFGWAFSGGLEGDVLYERASVGSGDDLRPAILGTALRGTAQSTLVSDAEVATAGAAAAGATEPAGVDTVLLPTAPVPPVESFSVRNERGGMVMGVPFAPGSVHRLDEQGGVWHGHGSEFRIFHSTLTGDTLREIVLEATPTPVTEAEISEWESSAGVARFREMGGRLDLSRIPRTKPFFNDIVVAPDGHLWVAVPDEPYRAQFAIFDEAGRYLGRVHIDGIEREVFVKPVIRNDRLYMVGRDELAVQRVYVFRIVR